MADASSHHSHPPVAHDPPPSYHPDPAVDAALQDNAVYSSHPTFVATYHTFKDSEDEVPLRKSGSKTGAIVLGVVLGGVLACLLLSLALSRRRDLSGDPTDPWGGGRHGKGGYGVFVFN